MCIPLLSFITYLAPAKSEDIESIFSRLLLTLAHGRGPYSASIATIFVKLPIGRLKGDGIQKSLVLYLKKAKPVSSCSRPNDKKSVPRVLKASTIAQDFVSRVLDASTVA